MATLPEIPRCSRADKATEAQLDRKKYSFILDEEYRWGSWAAPKGKDGKLDHNNALTGDKMTSWATSWRLGE